MQSVFVYKWMMDPWNSRGLSSGNDLKNGELYGILMLLVLGKGYGYFG
jgi:hypothetical protein